MEWNRFDSIAIDRRVVVVPSLAMSRFRTHPRPRRETRETRDARDDGDDDVHGVLGAMGAHHHS
jgi:hypothetical protein